MAIQQDAGDLLRICHRRRTHTSRADIQQEKTLPLAKAKQRMLIPRYYGLDKRTPTAIIGNFPHSPRVIFIVEKRRPRRKQHTTPPMTGSGGIHRTSLHVAQETGRLLIVKSQAAIGQHPNVAQAVFHNLIDFISRQRIGIAGIVRIEFQFIAVKTPQPFPSAYPHKTTFLGINTLDRGRHSLGYG